MANVYYHSRDDKCFAMAGQDEFLINDGLLTKTWDMLDFIDESTGWRQNRLKNSINHKKCGQKIRKHGSEIEKGRKNEIIGVSLKDNPDKARGKDGVYGIFEEGGKLPNLTVSWGVCQPSYEAGNKTTGLMIVFGTGGVKEADFEGLEEIFYHPETYLCLQIRNMWDEGAESNYGGFFVPANYNLVGFMDEDGNSDLIAAREFIMSERERIKRTSKDAGAIARYITEFPLTPREATLQIDSNIFPTASLVTQLNKVNALKLYQHNPSGVLYREEGKVSFKPMESRYPLLKFKTNKGDDLAGAVVIKEAPFKDKDGNVPKNLYIIGHDPYDQDGESTSDSLGAAYVFKTTQNFSLSYNDCVVAHYVGRPNTQDEYNETLFLLAEYYNAKIGYENDRGEVFAYAKRFKLLQFLQEEFKMLHKKVLISKATKRPYGMHMTKNRKSQGEIYIRDWLNTPIRIDEEAGIRVTILETIQDPALLEELIKFNYDGNFDRVMAVMIAQYHLKENYNITVYDEPTVKEAMLNEFFNRPLFARR